MRKRRVKTHGSAVSDSKKFAAAPDLDAICCEADVHNSRAVCAEINAMTSTAELSAAAVKSKGGKARLTGWH